MSRPAVLPALVSLLIGLAGELGAQSVEQEEASIVADIRGNGVGERLVISGVSANSGSPASVTISDVGGGAWSLAMEFPADQIPMRNFQSNVHGDGSIHRFDGEVRYANAGLPVFVGDGDRDNRLTFVLLANVGYVYVRGVGSVVFPDGRTIRLGDPGF